MQEFESMSFTIWSQMRGSSSIWWWGLLKTGGGPALRGYPGAQSRKRLGRAVHRLRLNVHRYSLHSEFANRECWGLF